MRYLFFFLIYSTCLTCCKAQSYFKVLSKREDQSTYYQLFLLRSDTQDFTLIYPIFWTNSIYYPNIDTIKVIEELLSYEDDDRLCSTLISSYNEVGQCSSNLYLGIEKRYSIQVEALYIINQIVFEEPCIFHYMSNPVLKDLKTGNLQSIRGEIIVKAYQSYKKWFEKVKNSSLQEILRKNEFPLDNSGIIWY
jgi:hypothetical protein